VKENNGFVLLKSLLTIAVILICAAVFYAALATAAKQSGNLGSRIFKELSFRREKIMERIR
jgi:multisubunit Na+/H+ antiporter MnhG subunit